MTDLVTAPFRAVGPGDAIVNGSVVPYDQRVVPEIQGLLRGSAEDHAEAEYDGSHIGSRQDVQ